MPTRFRSLAAAVAACPLVVLLGGCSLVGSDSGSGPAAASASSQPTDPSTFERSYRPIEAGSAGKSLAKGSRPIDVPSALETARAGRDRSAGEAAARDFAKLIMDAQPGSPAGEVELDAIAAPELDPEVRIYLIKDTDQQRSTRTGRHYDFRRGAYFRSQVTGPDDSPERVSLEVAGLLRAPALDHQVWYTTRYDVTWSGAAGWRLADFSDGRFGPYTTTLDKAQRKQFLTGPGWRAFA